MFGYKLETVNYALGYQETRYINSVNFEHTNDARLVTLKTRKLEYCTDVISDLYLFTFYLQQAELQLFSPVQR